MKANILELSIKHESNGIFNLMLMLNLVSQFDYRFIGIYTKKMFYFCKADRPILTRVESQ